MAIHRIVTKTVVGVGAVGVFFGSLLPACETVFRAPFELPHHAASTILAASTSTGSFMMIALPDHLEYSSGVVSNVVIKGLTDTAAGPAWVPPSVR